MSTHDLSVVPGNKVYFVQKDNEAAIRLMHKLARGGRPSQIIPLDPDEWDALQTSFMTVELPNGR